MNARFSSANALQAIVGAMVNQQLTGRPRSYLLEKVGKGLCCNDALLPEDLSAAVNKAVETGVISVEEAQTYFPGWEDHLESKTQTSPE
ncbi:MAG: hypothetical protein HW380_1037 [Magnetococcales bacterium]|nr:hypothetical protein [Magnetococcales bacterium]HIJ84524.1 hypothetical protein [Magnetococcales bacterium]